MNAEPDARVDVRDEDRDRRILNQVALAMRRWELSPETYSDAQALSDIRWVTGGEAWKAR